VHWRKYVLRLLLGLFGTGAILFVVFNYGWRVQAAVKLRSAEAVSGPELTEVVNGPMGLYASLFKGVFYVGSDDSFDYIAIKHGRLTAKALKVRRGNVAGIEHRMNITADEKKWVDLTPLWIGPAKAHPILQ